MGAASLEDDVMGGMSTAQQQAHVMQQMAARVAPSSGVPTPASLNPGLQYMSLTDTNAQNAIGETYSRIGLLRGYGNLQSY